ncbi:MAG: hypothetical protein E7246_07300 [Lachnoclostridium sp.]|nr:hypothetical protein [Lachnoclostridium sp.]
MEIAYLGLFDEVFEWVLSHIFDPVFQWLTNLLTTVFTWIFKELLEPILLPILKSMMEFAFELWMDIYSTFIYGLFAGVLKLIDYLETAFDVFIGLREVSYTSGDTTIRGSLLEVLLQMDTVNTVFWALTIAGLAIAIMLTIYATAKSTLDFDFENRRPVSKVLSAMLKTFFQFFTVPFFMFYFIKLATIILNGISYALGRNGSTSLGRIVFTIASLDAVRITEENESYASKYNISTASGKITLGTDPADGYRYPFYSGSKDYANIEAVAELFDLSEFDYFIGFIAAIFLLIVLAMCLLTFVQRIFEVMILYCVSPYFVSTIPIDDGERFGRWREMFVAKVFTGYGSAMGIRLYLMVCPMVMGNQIKFGSYVSTEMDYMMKLFFLIGGAWAVYKSGPMITGLFNFQAAQSEAATQAMVGGFVYGHTIGKAGNAVKSMLAGKGKRAGAANAGAGKAKTSSDNKSAKFNGMKPQQKSEMKKPQAGAWKAGVKPAGERTGKPMIGVKKGTPAGEFINNNNKPSDLKVGSLFRSTYDQYGNHKVRVKGFGVTKDASGKVTSVKLPGMKLKRDSEGAPFKVTKFNIPGIAKVNTNLKEGELKYSDISILGMNYHKEGGTSKFSMGKNISVGYGKDGTMSKLKIGSFKVYNTADKNGFDIGKFNVRSEAEGTKVNLGESISFKTQRGHKGLSSFKLGSIEYSSNGKITKKETGGDKA